MTTTLQPPRAEGRTRTGVDWRLRLALLAAIWGSSFLLIKVAVADLAPVQIAFGRCGFGAVAVLACVLVTRQRLPRERGIWGHLFVSAVLLNTVPFTLFGYAEQHVSSAVAGVANGTAPLFTVAFAVLALADERPSRTRLAALAVGVLGVAVVLGVWRGTNADTAGVLMALAATACYGAGWVYLPAVAAVLALGVLGTGIAYVVQHGVIRDVGATTASTVTYLVPMVAVAIGICVGQETLQWNVFAGAALVVLGAAVVNRSKAPRQSAGITARP